MKKSFLFLAVCAAAMTACTSEDVVYEGVQGNAIGFESVVGKASRATDLTKANLNQFLVYAYYTKAGLSANPVNVFDGEVVKLTGSEWGYTNTRYWVPDATYYFYAYSCGNGATSNDNGTLGMDLNATGVNNRALTISDFVCDNSHQHDLIFATNEGYVAKDKYVPTEEQPTGVNNDKVAFRFKHLLTKVNAVFTSEFAPGYDIVISKVKIVNVRNQGDYNPKAGEADENGILPGAWSNVTRTAANKYVDLAVSTSNNIASAAETEADEKKVTTGTAFVMPYAYLETDVRLEFTIEVKQGDDTFLSRDMVGTWKPNWKAGFSYTYNISITGTTADLEPIVFETKDNMDVDDFTTGSTNEVNMTFSAN